MPPGVTPSPGSAAYSPAPAPPPECPAVDGAPPAPAPAAVPAQKIDVTVGGAHHTPDCPGAPEAGSATDHEMGVPVATEGIAISSTADCPTELVVPENGIVPAAPVTGLV